MKVRDRWATRPRRVRMALAAAVSAAVVVAIVAGSGFAGTDDGGRDYEGLAHAARSARAASATSTSTTTLPTTTTSSTTATTATTEPAAPPAAQAPPPAEPTGGTSGGASSGGGCDPYCSTITDVPPPPDSEIARRVEETGSAVSDYDGRYQVDQTTGEVVDTGNASRAVAESEPVTVLTTPPRDGPAP